MTHFLDTVETIESGVGFQHFGSLHLVWLLVFLIITGVNCVWYRKLSDDGRKTWEKVVAMLLVADEVFKVVCLIIGGRYTPDYLPIHLCSINIFVIAIHAWKKSEMMDNFLYMVCIPGTLAALLFPSWTKLPLLNFMHLHSFTVHILLFLYPVVLTVNGVIRPDFKGIPKSLLLLVVMAGFALVVNLLLDTNFMFLMYADEGNPLYIFEQLWGSHLLGFPVIIIGVLLLLYLPMGLYRKLKRNKKTAE